MNDLEWLARHVHEWPKGLIEECACRFEIGCGGVAKAIATCRRPCGEDDDTEWFTHDQWLAERARLQNKPSWEDALKHSKYLAQDEDGTWAFFEDTPRPSGGEWEGHGFSVQYGEVLGDWRDTVEPRPEEQAMTKKEWRGPKDGLPPVGSCVEYFDAVQEVWQKQYIVAHHVCGEQAIFSESIDGGDLYYGVPTDFRPIQTEEDRAVEDMANIITKTYTDSKSELPSELPHRDSLEVYLREIYRAGYHKQEPFE